MRPVERDWREEALWFSNLNRKKPFIWASVILYTKWMVVVKSNVSFQHYLLYNHEVKYTSCLSSNFELSKFDRRNSLKKTGENFGENWSIRGGPYLYLSICVRNTIRSSLCLMRLCLERHLSHHQAMFTHLYIAQWWEKCLWKLSLNKYICSWLINICYERWTDKQNFFS